MNRRVRIASICVAAVILIALVLPRVVNVNSFRPKLENELSAALGRQVRIGELSLKLSGTVSADNISIADDPAFSSDPFITAKSFRAVVELRPLIFSRTLRVAGIELADPQITLLRGPDGTWNFSSLGKATAAPADQVGGAAESGDEPSLSVDKVTVNNGRVIIGSEKLANKPSVYEKVNLEVKDYSSTAPFPFTFIATLPGGGEVSVNGTSAAINKGDIGATQFKAMISVRKLDLAASGFVAPSSGIEGMADLDGEIGLASQKLNASGTMKAEKLKLAAKGAPMKRSVKVTYGLDYDLKTGAGTVTQGQVEIGKAVARLTGGYRISPGQAAILDLKISGNGMPVDDLEAALPAVGVVLPSGSNLQGGAVTLDLAVAGQSDKPVISGPIRLSNAKLAGFDLGSKMSAIPALAGMQTGEKDTSIQNLSATVRVSPEGVQANAINVDIPALGLITGGGTVSSSGALDFTMNATLSGGPGLIQKAGSDGQGGGVPFTIQGTASDPKFVPDVKSIAGNAITRKVTEAIPERPVAGQVRARRR